MGLRLGREIYAALLEEAVFVGVAVVPARCHCIISHELMMLFEFCDGQVAEGERAAGVGHLGKYNWRPLTVLLGLCPSVELGAEVPRTWPGF